MGLIPIEELVPGLVLGSDVHDQSGRLLLGAGATLEPKHLYIFRTWGVLEADIAGVEGGNSAALPVDVPCELLAQAEGELLPRFRFSNLDHPAVQELLRLGVLRKVGHGQE